MVDKFQDISIERRKTEIISEIRRLGMRNFFHRAYYLCDDIEVVNKAKDLSKEFSYLFDLQNNNKEIE